MVEFLIITSMYESMAAWFTPAVLFCLTNFIIATIFLASNKHHDHDHDHGDNSTTLTPIARVSSFIDRARTMNISSYTTTESQLHYTPQSKTPNYSSTSRLAQSIFLSYDYVTPPELSQSEERSASQPARPFSIFERVMSIKFSNEYKENVFPDQVSNPPSQLAHAPSFLDRVKSFKIYPAFKSEPENVETDPGHNPEHHVIRSKSEKTCEKKLLLVEMKKSRSEVKIAPDEDEDEDVDVRRPATARESRDDFDEEVDAKADDFISRFKQQLKLQRLESLVRYNEMLNRRSYK